MAVRGPLIGRETEITELEEIFSEARLLTVTGAGGCGKTRLALELADRIAGEHGTAPAVAMLASVAGEDQLLDAMVRALGAREQFGRSPREVLLECAAERRSPLLVLDNCEHLLAPAADVVAELLAAAPEIRIVATSREALGVSGEEVFDLRPLGLPEGDDGLAALVRSDAGRLFVDRATSADPTFELTPDSALAAAEVCRALDGLPLALCLAAARLREVSVEEIAGELARPGLSEATGQVELSRHDSLAASLEWSYRLLDEREKQLFRCLSVFSDGFTAEAAHAVGAPDLGRKEVRALLGSLEAKGLAVPVVGATGRERWELLETVSEFATHQLGREGEEDEAADRHLAWFASYAARADELLAQADGHRLIDEETANLRRALARAAGSDPEAALGIAASLVRHWVLGEHFQEGRSACAEALSVSTTGEETGSRAVLRSGAAVFALMTEDYTEALESVQAALEILAEVRDPDAEAECLVFCSSVLIQTGADLEEGFRCAERAVERERSSGRPLPLAYALVNLSISAGLCDRFDLAAAAYEELLPIRPACDHPRLRTWAEQAAAWAHVSVGSPRRALQHADRALELEGERPTMTHFQALGFRIQALARLGETDRARREGTEAMKRAEESGALVAVPAIEMALMVADLQSRDFDAAGERARRLLGMPHLHTLALAHETLARAALGQGDLAGADAKARELEAIAERSGGARQAAVAKRLMGSAAVRTGEIERGRDLLHDALRACAESGFERDAAETLAELALADAGGGSLERAARLGGAAAATWTRLECAPPTAEHELRALAAGLDGEAGRWRAAWEQGEALTLEEAIAYARRGRGPRDRPPAGWESLTPTELQVAELAAEGMSNPQIASQLFVSRSTVKLHLSNVYRKLGVGNRVELAALSR
jgi:predicted ATPase/DNA-binding CsgD family transcriptional regulator